MSIAIMWWLGVVLLASLVSETWRGWGIGGVSAGLLAGWAVGSLVVYLYPVMGLLLGWLWYVYCGGMGAVAGAVAAAAFRFWRHRSVGDRAALRRARAWTATWVLGATLAGTVCVAAGATDFDFYKNHWPSMKVRTRGEARIAITSDGTEIALAAEDGTLYVADAQQVLRQRQFRRVSRVGLSAVAYDARDKLLACGDRAGIVSVFRRVDLGRICVLESGDKPITFLAFIPSRMRLVSCSGDFVGPAKVMLWDLERCEREHAIVLSNWGMVEACAVSGDGELIAIAAGTTLKLLSSQRLTETAEYVHSAPIGDLEFSPDCRFLAVGFGAGDRGGGVCVWDFDQQRRVAVFEHGGAVTHVGFLESGAHVVSGSWLHSELRVWSMNDGEVIQVLRGSRYPIVAFAIARGTRRTCAAVYGDGVVAVWK